MAPSLTEYESLSVRTADAIARYMPGMRSDPFCFARMLTFFRLGVEDVAGRRGYGEYLKYAQAKDREAREKREAEAKRNHHQGKRRRSPPRRKSPPSMSDPQPPNEETYPHAQPPA